MKRKKQLSIGTRIKRVCSILLTVPLLIVGIGANCVIFLAAMRISQTTFANIVDAAVVSIGVEIDAITHLVQEMGTNTMLYDESISNEEITTYLQNKAKLYGYEAFYVTDFEGNSNTGFDFSAHEFFQVAINGKLYFSEPMATGNGRTMHIMVSAPLWKDGVYGGEVKGVVCAVIDGKLLSDLISQIHIGETGRLYIINADGYTIADIDYNTVLNKENSILESVYNNSLMTFANAEKEALKGKNTFTSTQFDGEYQFLYVAPLGDTGWAVGGMAYAEEYVGVNFRVGCTVACITILAIVLAYWVLSEFAKRLARPIVEITDVSKQMANGNYNVVMPKTKNDEIGQMAHNFEMMVSETKTIINDVVRCLDALANGDFTVKTQATYLGVFKNIESAINNIRTSINNVMIDVNECSDKVSVEASQVSNVSSSLSQGSSEQAASVEQLAATIHQISNQVKENANTSQIAHDLMIDVKNDIENSNQMMHDLNDAMHVITDRANEINKVVKTIDDIAFQTNILAINASIEASHAGVSGKGFAVVADEVRSLASKCAESVKNTEQLINASHNAIKTGSALADGTMEMLQRVVDRTIQVTEMVVSISKACVEQSSQLAETTSGIEQVSQVVQSNSAVAEQSSATSDELLVQATNLQKMLAKFKFNK